MTEHDHQVLVIEWADILVNQYPDLNMLYAVPNGGERNIVVATRLKAEGVRAGFPDMNLDVAKHGFHGLRIELKKPKGRLQPNQADWIDRLTNQGYMAVMCIGANAAIDTISGYLGIPK